MTAVAPIPTAGGYELYELYREYADLQPAIVNAARGILDDVSYDGFLKAKPDQLAVVQSLLIAVNEAWAGAHDVLVADAPRVVAELNRQRARAEAKRLLDTSSHSHDAALKSQQIRRNLVTGLDVLDLPEPGWLIEDVIPAESLVLLYGPPKGGKSFIALDQALSFTTGRAWAPSADRKFGAGYEPFGSPHGGQVLYVAAEGVGGLPKRVQAWMTHNGVDDPGRLTWLTRPIDLRDESDVTALLDIGGIIDPHLIVFDTLARCTPGAEENSGKDMGQTVAALDRIREALGCTVMPVHHSGKDISKGLRGHSALHGAADAIYQVTRSGQTVTWQCADIKDSEEPRPMNFKMTPVDRSIVLVPGIAEGDTPDGNFESVVRSVIRAVKTYEAETGKKPSRTQIMEAATVKARHQTKRAALEYAVDAGALKEEQGPRRAVLYSFVGELVDAT